MMPETDTFTVMYIQIGKVPPSWVFIHYKPFHGSWLNMIEIWFGILKKKCIERGNSEGYWDLDAKIMSYIHLWDYFFAHPFNWTFTEKKFIEWYEKQCEALPTEALPVVA